ncbi:hypothetical protein Trydic_g2581 [Trypoxylus dichotomus]
MESPLSPVICNIFMEAFEHEAIESSRMKRKCWYRYVDDTFVIWPDGPRTLEEFLQHINRQHANVNFTMEIEEDGSLPFLDVLVERTDSNKLGHNAYRPDMTYFRIQPSIFIRDIRRTRRGFQFSRVKYSIVVVFGVRDRRTAVAVAAVATPSPPPPRRMINKPGELAAMCGRHDNGTTAHGFVLWKSLLKYLHGSLATQRRHADDRDPTKRIRTRTNGLTD